MNAATIWLVILVLVVFVSLLLVLFFGIVAAIFGNESDLNSDLLDDGDDHDRKATGTKRR
jgi:hypothetical protein